MYNSMKVGFCLKRQSDSLSESEGVNDELYGRLGGQQQSYFDVDFIQMTMCVWAVGL